MQRVLYVATVVKTHIMEFHIPFLRMFKELGWETFVAAKNDYEDPANCIIPYCDHYFDIPFERTPYSIGNAKAYRKLKSIIYQYHFNIIHCHTPVGSVLTRLAAKKNREDGCKIIYTAHGFHFYKGAPLRNWLLYYPIERYLAHRTDTIITINHEDYKIAKKFAAGRIEYIPGIGIDFNKFAINKEIQHSKRKEIGIGQFDFAILSVGELIPRKNHRIILEALKLLKTTSTYKHLHYYLCGQGDLSDELKQLSINYGINDHVHFMGYRQDIAEICNACDAFVFMSLQEGLPVALLEAMACGLPVICSNIRGNRDLVEDMKNGIVAKSDPISVANAIQLLYSDDALRSKISENSRISIQQYSIENVIKRMKEIYFTDLHNDKI